MTVTILIGTTLTDAKYLFTITKIWRIKKKKVILLSPAFTFIQPRNSHGSQSLTCVTKHFHTVSTTYMLLILTRGNKPAPANKYQLPTTISAL